MYTRHGHQIPGTSVEGRPDAVARCGGIALCMQCLRDAAKHAPIEDEPPEIETDNDALVSVQGFGPGARYRLMNIGLLSTGMNAEQAVRCAAWLVALADEHGTFPAVLKAVQNT